MNKFKWMPILRTGTFIDKNKKTVTIDEDTLDKVISSTDLSQPPQFVIDHPRFDKVGFGGISALKRVGNYLFALPKEVDEKFKQVVNAGELPGRSCTLDKNTFALRNISFLPPNVPPAVSELGAYSFSSDAEQLKVDYIIKGVESHFADIESDQIEFARLEVSSYPFRSIQTAFRNIKNFLIEKFSLEDAELVLPEGYMDGLGSSPMVWEIPDSTQSSFSQHNNGDNKMTGTIDLSKFDLSKVDQNLRTAIEGLSNRVNTLETQLSEKNIELQAASSKLTAAETASLKNEVLQFCASDDVKLKVIPAMKDKVVNFLMAQKEKGVIEFSSGENTTVKLDLYEFAQELVKMLPDSIELSEVARRNGKAATQEPDYLKTAKEIAGFANN